MALTSPFRVRNSKKKKIVLSLLGKGMGINKKKHYFGQEHELTKNFLAIRDINGHSGFKVK